MRWFVFFFFVMGTVLNSRNVSAQIEVSGTVFDSSKIYGMQHVLVLTTAGEITRTDSAGQYHINMQPGDSIYFFYAGKNTLKYALSQIPNPNEFDISLHARTNSPYKVLKEVVVFSDTYRFDSLENRKRYEKIFGNTKGKIQTSVSPDGIVGLDVGSIVELFQFKKNRRANSFQNRLILQEEEGYVNYRFNARLISRITGLQGDDLENYRQTYRPTYEFASKSTLEEFYQYILNTSYAYKRAHGIP